MDIDRKEELLREKLEKIDALEKEIKEREKAVKARENARKQVLLRLSPSLWNDIAAWAEEDFRSINGQIEYLLTEAVSKRKKSKYNAERNQLVSINMNLRFQKATDMDVVDYIKAQPNKVEYIRQLVRADMQAKQNPTKE